MPTDPRITSVGKYTYGLDNIRVFSWGEPAEIQIGAFCSIATDCQIFLGGNHNMKTITTFPFGMIHQHTFDHPEVCLHPLTNGNVVIENDVWIGHGVTIMSGVTIGSGAVIAANTHVVKNVPPYAIVGGNPSRVIRRRFGDEEIEELLKIQWWQWEDKTINALLPYICSEDVTKFITLYKDSQYDFFHANSIQEDHV